MNLEEVKNLSWRDEIYDNGGNKWRVNGAVKLWKRSPEKVRVPLKYGMGYSSNDYCYITEKNMESFSLEKGE